MNPYSPFGSVITLVIISRVSNGQPHLLHFQRTGEGTILNSSMHTFRIAGEGDAALTTQVKHELIITSVREDGVIQHLWWNDRTFTQAIHT